MWRGDFNMTCLKKLIKELNKHINNAEELSLGNSRYATIITLPGKNPCCDQHLLPHNDIAIAINYTQYHFDIYLTNITSSKYVWETKKNWLGVKKIRPTMKVETITFPEEGRHKGEKELIKLIQKVDAMIDERERRKVLKKFKRQTKKFCAGVGI